ncbi:hypothetical protein E4U21_003292 [Claviceps maximensis]|nr:hypothetical protein E4U21_003292 [Claviceps maximensis]
MFNVIVLGEMILLALLLRRAAKSLAQVSGKSGDEEENVVMFAQTLTKPFSSDGERIGSITSPHQVAAVVSGIC